MSTKTKKPAINIKLYKNGEMVGSTTLPSKTRILNWIRSKNDQKWVSGYVRVTYNYKEGYYNHADFQNITQAKQIMEELLDPYLIERYGLTNKA